ncbi:MAG: hypothetical protein BWK77_03865 [Verrucomicrobia bacterium A1]|nr:MAG: hypothetical protein BWK77_03865 [Verrucomicrobia bacterium A1]
MKFILWRAAVACTVGLALPPPVPAQQQRRETHIGYVHPAGGRQGATFEVTVGGESLDGVSGLEVSGRGVEAVVLKHIKTLTQQQLNNIRNNFEKMEQLQEMGKSDPAKATEAAAIRKRIEAILRSAGIDGINMREIQDYRRKMNDPKRQVNPAISETVTLRITVAPDAPLGDREIRMRTDLGLTNPLRFQVGRLPEINESEPNDRIPETALPTATPFVVNGQIMPGDLDKFRFRAKKGEKLVASVAARALIPYLADAVPGWFQATLSLRDAKGNELAYSDDDRFDPDPVVYCRIPEDGEYILEVKDSIFRGREDFVYRLSVGELPHLSAVFPLGGRAGVPVVVQATGWNLPKSNVTLTPGGTAPGVVPIAVDMGDRISNYVPFATDTVPECMEAETNDDVRAAQRVAMPVIVNGRIDRPGDRDVFRIEGRNGETVVVEVVARRLHSPLDSVVRVFDAQGKELASNDDYDDKGAGLITHQADSRVQFTVPADGPLFVHVADTQGKGSPAHAYRCRISPRRPGFELRVVPASLNLRAGTHLPFTVYALRRDGFDGDIVVDLKDAPAGFAIAGGRIPSGQEKIRMTLLAPPAGTNAAIRLAVEGRATILGREVRRDATPADDRMQAFFYRHLVPAESLMATVTERMFKSGPPPRILADGPVKIAPGGTASIAVQVAGRAPKRAMTFDLDEPPEGLSIANVDWGEQRVTIHLKAEAGKAKAGLKGNLIVDVLAEGGGAGGKDGKPAGGRRIPIGVLPAIPFEVVGP